MASSYNKVILLGNLTRDIELKFTPKGTAVARVGLACNRQWKTDSGEKKEACDFIDCEAWGKTAEIMSQHLRKGSPVFLDGRLQLDQWEKDGQKHSKLKVVIDTFNFVGSKQDGQSSGQYQPQAAPSSPPPQAAPATSDMPPDDDKDSVPF